MVDQHGWTRRQTAIACVHGESSSVGDVERALRIDGDPNGPSKPGATSTRSPPFASISATPPSTKWDTYRRPIGSEGKIVDAGSDFGDRVVAGFADRCE
jgi:hypothetical protein